MEIIDSHTHWGPSVTMGTEVTTEELLKQAEQTGVSQIVIFPFPSMALADEEINEKLLEESNRIKKFIPYYYIPETMKPIPDVKPHEQSPWYPTPRPSGATSRPNAGALIHGQRPWPSAAGGKGFYGGKWHWMWGIQDCSSNYQALEDPRLDEFIEASEKINLPIVFEEELAFTEVFVRKTKNLKIIIPHLGMLGGNPMDFLHTFKGRENVYFDTALASSDTVMKFIEKIGHERILFGSDIPFGTMKWELEKVLSLPIGDDKKEWIFYKNIKKLIRLT
jgi:uncharacterized protein